MCSTRISGTSVRGVQYLCGCRDILATLHAEENEGGDEQLLVGDVQDAQWGRLSHNTGHSPASSDNDDRPLRIPLRAEKLGKTPKVPGKADCTRGRGKGVVNCATKRLPRLLSAAHRTILCGLRM